jgi:hypothetical protein
MTLEDLSVELLTIKKLEAEAKTKRLALERQLLDLLKDDQGTGFQINSGYTYEADPASLMMATMSWPAELQPAYLSPKIDEGRLNKIRCEMPDLWKQIIQEVEIKYKPTSVSLLIDLE